MSIALLLSSSIAIFVSFLCSLAEALLLSLNPVTLNRLKANNPRAVESWKRLKKNVARPITAILVLNTVAHTGGATVAGAAFSEVYGDDKIWIFSVIFTVVVLFGTEILPKIIGVTFRDRLAPVAGPILEVLTTALYPIIHVSEMMFKGLTSHAESDQITTGDLVTLASLAKSGKAISSDQENIIVNTVRLSHTPITRDMIPPAKVILISSQDRTDAIITRIRDGGHTRYPVSRTREVKDIYAYIVAKNIPPASGQDLSQLLSQAKPIHTVSCKATLMTALQIMLQNKEHMLAVVSENNACVGIVTLEDIASELLSADLEDFK